MRKLPLTAAAAVFAAALPAFCPRTLQGASSAAALAADVALRVLERVTPELTDPPVRFRVQEEEAQDPFALGEASGLAQAAAWQIQVFDNAGRKAAYVQGTGRPSAAAIPWGGTTPDGDPLPDGFYEARLVWLDAERRAYSTRPETLSLVTPLEIRALAGRKLKFRYTEEGLVITLDEKLIFRPGSSEIQPGALPALEETRKFLAAHPANKVNVRGYTDASGAAEANLKLSRERAQKVYRYFVGGGIPEERIAYFGLGAAQPVASNGTPEGRAKNRRVDVVMLKPDAPL